MFSHDGRLIAYYKLADEGYDHDLMELAYGIAIYDVTNRQETLVTKDARDHGPIGFSKDMTKLYFNSTRKAAAPVWVVNTDGSGLKQQTNVDFKPFVNPDYRGKTVPLISYQALWSSDRKTIISPSGKGIWIYSINTKDTEMEARFLTAGEQPVWLVQDRTIAFRNGIGDWQTLDIQ